MQMFVGTSSSHLLDYLSEFILFIKYSIKFNIDCLERFSSHYVNYTTYINYMKMLYFLKLTAYRLPYVKFSSVSSQSNNIPGFLDMSFIQTASPGCTRITSSLRWISSGRKILPETSRNCIRTSALRSFRATNNVTRLHRSLALLKEFLRAVLKQLHSNSLGESYKFRKYAEDLHFS